MKIDKARGVSGALLRYTAYLPSNTGKSVRTVLYLNAAQFPLFPTDSLKPMGCEYMLIYERGVKPGSHSLSYVIGVNSSSFVFWISQAFSVFRAKFLP